MPRVNIDDIKDLSGEWVEHLIEDKKSTYRYAILDRNTANVFKSLDALAPAAYEIRDGICSCPAALHSRLCKHVKTVTRLAAD